jgi:hypothetical protein
LNGRDFYLSPWRGCDNSGFRRRPEAKFKQEEAISYTTSMKDKPFTYKFDFEIGYLVKSPCKTCRLQNTFPKCADKCSLLDEIHAVLAEAVSLTRS